MSASADRPSSDEVLPDVLAVGLDIVFCGTAPGEASARRRAYYAGPGNAFWPTLFRVGLTPRKLDPEEYRMVLRYGLGLTDLVKTTFGADAVLPADQFNRERLRAVVLRHEPRILAFTSKRGAKEFLGRSTGYGLLADTIGRTRLFVLPSPSGAARRYWDERPWQELAVLRATASTAPAPE